MIQEQDNWWRDTLAAIARHDLPAARRAASRGIAGNDDSRSWLALAAIHRAMGDLRTAQNALQRAYDCHSLFIIPAVKADAPKVVVLAPVHLDSLTLLPSGMFWSGGSVDWSLFLDGEFEQIIAPPEMLDRQPEKLGELQEQGDVVVNLITDPDAASGDLARAQRLIDRIALPVVNHPEQVLLCGRAGNAKRFADVPGLVFPETFEIELPPTRRGAITTISEAAERLKYPFILRRSGWHDGRFMHRIDTPDAIEAVQLAPGGGLYHVIRYHDVAGRDGLYRKTRMFFIGGEWYPRHVFSGRSWNVHFGSYQQLLETELGPKLVREELDFLDVWREGLGTDGLEVLRRVASIVALDWFGMDFTLLPSGELFVFEINPAMRVTGSQRHTGLRGERVQLMARFRNGIVDATRAMLQELANSKKGKA